MADNIWLGLQLAGPAANRPTTPTIEQGNFVQYLATDTGVLSLWNPATAAWVTGSEETAPGTVAQLPAASASNRGSRTFITDGAATPVFGAIVAGSGSLFLPVFSDGTNWLNG
jgi:hypothetical protein